MKKSTGKSLFRQATSGAKYLAVYDKKMLWRANLYINQSEDALGGRDWNDVYPWNAPPGDPAIASNISIDGAGKKAVPAWWDRDWGYNEWNRIYDGSRSELTSLTGLSLLSTGNGGQVVKMIPFVPERTLFGAKNAPNAAKNIISNSVAYSYPTHSFEPGEWSGASGSADSPFDYNKKMELQVELLRDWYNAAGKMFAKPRSSWPQKNATSTNGFSTWEQYKQNVTGVDNGNKIVSDKTFAALNIDSTNWKNIIELNAVLSKLDANLPPDGRWWNYVAMEPEGWSSGNKTPATKSFVPSLGLRIGMPNSSFDEVAPAQVSASSFINRQYVLEAGTDCVGFAQRSMSWRFFTIPMKKNSYVWHDLPDGMAEYSNGAGKDNIWDVMKDASGRIYPTATAKGGQNEAGATVLCKETPRGTAAEKADFLSRLKQIVPGDIWVKDSTTNADGLWDDHIAIVASVPENPEIIQDIYTYLKSIILIEAEYTNRIQSVVKFISMYNYDMNQLTVADHGGVLYDGVSIPPDGILLRCNSWAIRRLK